MKFLKKFCFSFLIFILCFSSIDVNAESYLDWKQTDKRWSSIKIGTRTVGAVGCTSVSISILLMHSGIMKDDFNPKQFVEGYKKAGGYNNNSFKWGVLDSYTDGKFKYKGDTGEKSNMNLNELKKLYDKGYYVTVCMFNNSKGGGTHWLALLDGSSTDPKKIKIADPYYNSKNLYEACKNSGNDGNHLRFVYYECTQSKSNEKGASDSSSSNEDEADKVTPVTDGSNKVKLDNGKWGLVDPMSGKVYELSENSIPLADLELFTDSELRGVTEWKNNIEYNKSKGINSIIRVLVLFTGILFLVWVILIYLSYWYDRINELLDIELLPKITGGRLRVAPEEDKCTFNPKEMLLGHQQTVNHRMILVICFTGILFGVLIISGKIYDCLSYLVYIITSMFKII